MEMTDHRYLVALADEEAEQAALVGRKAAGLSRFVAAGFHVPEAVVLTTRAFEDTFGSDSDPTSVLARSFPSSVEEALLKVVRRFGDITLAVRSSAVAEDRDDASFAGQFETVLGVRGVEALVDAVRRCWASAFSPQVDDYRHKRHIAVPSMAVLMQRQVDAVAGGAAFTADPVTGDRRVTVINAVAGLADRLMSGEVTPEEWRVAENVERTSGPKRVLTPDQAESVAQLASKLATLAGGPQDVEWVLDESRIWLLQSRPITALPKQPIEPVPIPVDIPDGYWERDVSHWPDPVSPLVRSTLYPMMNQATPQFLAEFGMLAERIILADIGGWHYLRTVPFGGKDRKPPPTWLARTMVRLHPGMRRRVRAAIDAVRNDKTGTVIDRWYREWMPSLDARAARLRDADLPILSDDELSHHLDELLVLQADGIRIHTMLIGAQMVGIYSLIDTARDLLAWEVADTVEMLRGLSQRSTEPARQLSELAKMTAERPDLQGLLEDIDLTTVERLEEVDPEFSDRFKAYREKFGLVPLTRDLKDPTLAERPDLILHLIKNQVAQDFDPSSTDHGNNKDRVQMLAQARAELTNAPVEDQDRFEEALRRGERAYPIREDNVFYTLFIPAGLIRRAALEVGNRLRQRGQIDGDGDVFFLEYDELVNALHTGTDQHDLITRRAGEQAWVLANPGPATYGQPLPQPQSLAFLPAEARHTMEAMLTMIDLIVDTGDPSQNQHRSLKGIAASPGAYTGTARVINGEHEFVKLRAGDVLVCPITSPTWSVLFPTVGALVTDSGGILNHPAIIAREYRIPAVVATGNATQLLSDGQHVTVDGSAGTVVIS